jgi:hypothetical protein
MRLHKRMLALVAGIVAALVVSVGLTSTATAQPRTAEPATAVVEGTLANGTGAVDGTFDVERFVVQGGALQAVGTFTGTITDEAGNVLAEGSQSVTLPVDVQQSDGSCEILNLVLGPLNLNLLGLEVFLDTVTLIITAQQGPGNLLGNLLCAVAGLLDGPTGLNAILQQIARLLNQLLGVLG